MLAANSLGCLFERFWPGLSRFYTRSELRRVCVYKLEAMGVSVPGFPLWVADFELDLGVFRELEIFLRSLLSGCPYQYLLGYAFFDGWRVLVSPAVLIPRSETEELLNYARGVLCGLNISGEFVVLDLATGSGVLGLGLKRTFALSELWLVDISAEALEVAGQNAELQFSGLSGINFLQADILAEPVLGSLLGLFRRSRVIIANPPYIPDSELATIDYSVRAFEPHLALLVPRASPFCFYLRIMELASCYSCRPVYLFFECHSGNILELLLLLRSRFSGCTFTLQRDFADMPRFIFVEMI